MVAVPESKSVAPELIVTSVPVPSETVSALLVISREPPVCITSWSADTDADEVMLCPVMIVIPILLAAVGTEVAATPVGETNDASVETIQVAAVPQAPDEADR